MTKVHAWEVAVDGTLRDVLGTIERGGMRVAVATSTAGQVVGIMTDGDARRALLADVPLHAPLAPLLNRGFTRVQPSAARAEVLDLMHARHLDAIPIVDTDGTLVGLHQLHAVLRVDDRPNIGVIMAGGRGTRLGALTEQLPKPMIRVAGRPILERLVLHLVGFGVRRIYIAIHYLGHLIEEHFGDGARFGCTIEYLRETTPLGTAGALSLLPAPPQHPVVIANGDLVTQANVRAMLEFHTAGDQRATIGVRPYFHTVPFGCVELDGTRVRRFMEKPRDARIVNAGIYVLAPEIVADVAKGEPTSMPVILESCLARGEVVRAFEIEDDWIDVGHRDQLREARGEA